MASTTTRLVSTCKCNSRTKKEARNSSFSVLSGFLLALLPKCHFCILAYSSAVTVCGRGTYYDHTPEWTSLISIGLSVLTLVFVLINRKGKRTWYATGLILVGIVFIGISELYTGELIQYYLGATLLMAGVWINANFLYFFHHYIKPIFMSWDTQVNIKEIP